MYVQYVLVLVKVHVPLRRVVHVQYYVYGSSTTYHPVVLHTFMYPVPGTLQYTYLVLLLGTGTGTGTTNTKNRNLSLSLLTGTVFICPAGHTITVPGLRFTVYMLRS